MLPVRDPGANQACSSLSSDIVEYLNTEGTGYAQQGFKWPCASCGFPITKTALAMDKLAQDIVKNYNDADATMDAYLPYVRRACRPSTLK